MDIGGLELKLNKVHFVLGSFWVDNGEESVKLPLILVALDLFLTFLFAEPVKTRGRTKSTVVINWLIH